jgi:hypothetical protein
MTQGDWTQEREMKNRKRIDRAFAIRDERMAEFRKMGLKPEDGRWIGTIQFSATDAVKLLKLLKSKRNNQTEGWINTIKSMGKKSRAK